MLKEYAKNELMKAGLTEKQDEKTCIADNVLELIDVFSKQGHSGSSARTVLDLFYKIASYQPILPLTGSDDEWVEIAEGLWQNRICSSVFKDEKLYNGQAYDIDGRLFSKDNGKTWYRPGREGDLLITFPYIPGNPEYIIIPPDEEVSAETEIDGECEFVED